MLAFFCWFVFALCWIILLPEHSFPIVAAKIIPSDILKIFIKKKKSFQMFGRLDSVTRASMILRGAVRTAGFGTGRPV